MIRAKIAYSDMTKIHLISHCLLVPKQDKILLRVCFTKPPCAERLPAARREEDSSKMTARGELHIPHLQLTLYNKQHFIEAAL